MTLSFTSYSFLMLFLPVTLLLYLVTPTNWRRVLLLVCSYIFYGVWNPWFLVLLMAITGAAYAFGLLLERTAHKKIVVMVGVVLNVAALAYFKYAQFGLDSLNSILSTLNLEPVHISLQILLPVGLSFYVFNAIAYIVDVYRGQIRASRDPLGFAASMALFASLLNGPLLRQAQIAVQLETPQITALGFSSGAVRFMVGFCKKLLIADTLSPLVQACFSMPNASAADVWLGGISYTIQLYYDFSGYSDMAIGVASMFGLRLPENFNHPYTALSITEFWQRWHLSLSSFLKNYVYIPLGGNRHSEFRTYFNLFATMVVGGLWHGANWTFVLWGAWNGSFLMLERFLKSRLQRPAPPAWYALPKMLAVVVLGRMFFISSDVASALERFAGAFGFHGFALGQNAQLSATPERLMALIVGMALCYIAPKFDKLEFKSLTWSRSLLLPLFVLTVVTVAARSATPFLYFKF